MTRGIHSIGWLLALVLGFAPVAAAQTSAPKPPVPAKTSGKQTAPPVKTSGKQTVPPTKTSGKQIVPKAKTPSSQAKPPAKQSKPPVTPTTKTARTPAMKTAKAPKKPEAEPKHEAAVVHRDPFAPLISLHKAGGASVNLPAGKAGLEISTLRVDGTVRSPNGMLAVVRSPQQRVYFLKEGESVYDGQVEKITLDGVVFRQNAKDAFGKPVQRLVTKRLYPTAGEQP